MTATRVGMPPCPSWCALPEGHAHPTGDEPSGKHFRAHETAPIGVPGAVTVEQGEVVGADGSVEEHHAPAIHIDGRVQDGDSMDAAQARQLAAALLDAGDLLDRIKAGTTA